MKKQVKPARKPEPVKRDLSQIQFEKQHWWKQQPWQERFFNKGTTPIDVQKAAMIYEAARRRPEIQRAWLEGKPVRGDNGHFIAIVVRNLPSSWVELDEIAQAGIVRAIQLPWFVPPKGYSVFPTMPSKEKNAKVNSAPEKRGRAAMETAMQLLRLPKPPVSGRAAKAFVERAQKFMEAGFVIAAVDNKNEHNLQWAIKAIKRLPRSVRKADRGQEWIACLPTKISGADRAAAIEKMQRGAFTRADLDELWRKYLKPGPDGKPATAITATLPQGAQVPGFVSQWTKKEEVRPVVMYKRKRGENVIEDKLFNADEICRDFERRDLGLVPAGDFIQRTRL